MSAVPQHMVALEGANTIRLARADRRAEVEALDRIGGARLVADLLTDPPREINTLNVHDLLCWIHRVRDAQARRIMVGFSRAFGAKISETRQVGQLTERQRLALARYLRGESAGRWAA